MRLADEPDAFGVSGPRSFDIAQDDSLKKLVKVKP
jgi:hypothetical protein